MGCRDELVGEPVMALRCPICRGEQIERRGKRSSFDRLDGYAPFVPQLERFDREIVRCATCRLSFIDPMYDEDDISALYGDPGYSAFQTHIAPEGDYKSPKGRVLLDTWKEQFRALGVETFAKEVLARQGKATLLDIGCGFGRNLIICHELGFEVTGVELNEREAAGARSLGDFRVLSASAQEFEKSGERFDCVLASHVLEHVTDPVAFLQTLDRLAAPGGLIVLETPLADDNGRPDERFRDIYHTLFFDHFTLQLLTAQSGYRATACQNILFGADSGVARCLFMQLAIARCERAPLPAPATLAHLRSAYDALLGDALTWSHSYLYRRNRQEL